MSSTIASRFSISQQGVGVLVALFASAVVFRLLRKPRNNDEPEHSSHIVPPNSATQEVCATLRLQFPDISYGPEDVGFWSHLKYWSSQARIPTPALVVQPRSTDQLSQIVKILAEAVKSSTGDNTVRFAIKSGGHNPVQGFANVESGVMITLSHLVAIELSEDHRLVTIEPGATWGSVYRKLQRYGLAVAGGRASSVGVGGLTLGGGLSFFSPQVGFVCDNTQEFEVVLADGSVVIASEQSHPDLAIALRGTFRVDSFYQ